MDLTPRAVPTLTAEQAAAASVSYDEVRSVAGAVWWLESRPDDGGRVALICDDGRRREVTPPGANVGCELHGYGGGAYSVDGDRIWYIDATDGHLRLIEGDAPTRVVVQRESHGEQLGDLTALGGRLWCVRERGDGDELLEVEPDGSVRVLTRTDGFLGSPRPAPGRLAWLRWAADRMPWDASELLVADYWPGQLGPAEPVAGGPAESVSQPSWTDDGRLWFVSDRTGWANLYTWRRAAAEVAGSVSADLAPPEWEAGYQGYVPLPDGEAVVVVQDGPRHRLAATGPAGLRPVPTPYTSFKPYLAAHDGQVLAIAASPRQSPHVVAIDLAYPHDVRPIAQPEAMPADVVLSVAEQFEVPTPAGNVTALVYPPVGAAASWRAPLVVRAHPGPTASINTRLDWHIQFLTSHGYAVVDVDYHGSAGYGRAFRESLYGRWGTTDVQDCAAVARHLLDAGRTQPGQVFVTGASAGGYTALQSVSGRSLFAAAVARSAIVDPRRWQHTAPRWQRPHAVALLGPAGAVRPEAITRPVLFIHGADDHVAPLRDVTELADQLGARGHPHTVIVLGAAGHQLSAQQETAQALDAEVAFYRTVMAG